jgi:hypothetical protein
MLILINIKWWIIGLILTLPVNSGTGSRKLWLMNVTAKESASPTQVEICQYNSDETTRVFKEDEMPWKDAS